MDVNSNLLRLKLEMVYRDLSMEEAKQRFSELNTTVEPKTTEPVEMETKIVSSKPKRKVRKALIPKTK
jgi:hypothetical protein